MADGLSRLFRRTSILFAPRVLLRITNPYLDGVFDGLIREVNRLIRQVITDHLMTLHLSGTEVLRLGRGLTGTFRRYRCSSRSTMRG